MKHLFLISVFTFLASQNYVCSQNAVEKWRFVEKKSQKVKTLKKGQTIQVVWLGLSKQITSKGKLKTITADSLMLDIKGFNASFAQKDIEVILVKRRANVFEWILGVSLILASLVVTGGVIALSILFSMRPYNTTGGSAGEGLRIVLPFLFLGYLGVLAILPRQKAIRQPFGENWSVREISTKPNNMP